MKTNFSKIIGFIGLSFLVSCAAQTKTSMSSSWQKPSSSLVLNGSSKVMVIAMTDNESQRKVLEDAYVRRLEGQGTASYSYFQKPISQISQIQALDKMQNDSYSDAMIIRLVDQSHTGSNRQGRVSVNPNLYYNFNGNWNGGIGINFYPGSNTKEDSYSIETSVYELANSDLIWSGTTFAANPTSINQLASDVSSQVFNKMRSDGLLK